MAAADRLVARHGDFTVTELAKALKVHPSSLYHHVSGREEVVEMLRARVGAEIDVSGFGAEPWDAAMERFARSYRLAFARRRGAIPLLSTAQIRDADALAAYERVAAALLGAGFPRQRVALMIQALDSFLLGSAFDVEMPDEPYAADPSAHPALAAALAATATGDRAEAVFEIGLRALIDGFRGLL